MTQALSLVPDNEANAALVIVNDYAAAGEALGLDRPRAGEGQRGRRRQLVHPAHRRPGGDRRRPPEQQPLRRHRPRGRGLAGRARVGADRRRHRRRGPAQRRAARVLRLHRRLRPRGDRRRGHRRRQPLGRRARARSRRHRVLHLGRRPRRGGPRADHARPRPRPGRGHGRARRAPVLWAWEQRRGRGRHRPPPPATKTASPTTTSSARWPRRWTRPAPWARLFSADAEQLRGHRRPTATPRSSPTSRSPRACGSRTRSPRSSSPSSTRTTRPPRPTPKHRERGRRGRVARHQHAVVRDRSTSTRSTADGPVTRLAVLGLDEAGRAAIWAPAQSALRRGHGRLAT